MGDGLAQCAVGQLGGALNAGTERVTGSDQMGSAAGDCTWPGV